MQLRRRKNTNPETGTEIEVWEQTVSEPYSDEVEAINDRADGIRDESRHYSSEEAAERLDFDVDN